VWRLWLKEKINMSEFDQLSIVDIDSGNAALDAWDAAEIRASKKAARK
jgi:hypothetical protein